MGCNQDGGDKASKATISACDFYANYYGHPPADLAKLLHALDRHAVLYLAGDSSLDNKHWLPSRHESHPQPHHRALLDAPVLRRDISYWLGHQLRAHAPVNCAVEASSLRQRLKHGLLAQDALLRDHLTSRDALVVCVGGNDIALHPFSRAACSALLNVHCGGRVGMRGLGRVFHDDLQRYVELLTERVKPAVLAVCMVYYPAQETDQASWAAPVLRLLRYNGAPRKLQAAYRRVFDRCVTRVRVDGTRMAHVALYQALDGRCAEHYVERVEPSEEGGRRVADVLVGAVEGAMNEINLK